MTHSRYSNLLQSISIAKILKIDFRIRVRADSSGPEPCSERQESESENFICFLVFFKTENNPLPEMGSLQPMGFWLRRVSLWLCQTVSFLFFQTDHSLLKRFDSSRWGGGSDGHLYDFAKRSKNFDSSRWGSGSDGYLRDFVPSKRFHLSRWGGGSDGHLYDFAKK